MKIPFLCKRKMTEMEEQFTKDEQEAIANVLINLARVDYASHQSENKCVESCLSEIGFEDDGFVPISKNELQSRAYDTIRKMSKEKKRIFSRMMTQVSRSDGNFGAHERALVIEVLEMCDVPFVHK